MSKQVYMMAAAVAALCAPAAYAQVGAAPAQVDPAPQEEQPPAPQSGGIDRVVVTARRSEESVQTVPLAINVATADDLLDLHMTEVRDIARTIPNFQALTSNGDPGSVLLTIRGVSAQDRLLTTDSPIGVYVDGVNFVRHSNLETAFIDIERVEVLKGPQGTLFGKNTTGGAINVTTKQPSLNESGGYLTVGLADFETRNLVAAVDLPLVNDKLAVRLVASHTERGGYGNNFAGDDIGAQDQDFYRVNVLFEPNDSIRWAFSGDFAQTDSSGPVARLISINQVPSTVPGTPAIGSVFTAIAVEAGLLNPGLLANPTANAAQIQAAAQQARNLLVAAKDNYSFYSPPLNDQFGYARTAGLSSNLAIDLSSDLQFRSITAVRWGEMDALPDLDGSPYHVTSVRLFQNDVRNVSQELQLARDGDGFMNWIVGAYANEEVGTDGSRSNTLAAINPNVPNVYDSDVKNSSIGLFGQSVMNISENVRATVGLRWSEETRKLDSRNRIGPAGTCNIPVSVRVGGQCLAQFENSYSDLSYLASVDWQPSSDLMLYARTARGFKGGGQNLRGSAGSADTFAPYEPETVTDYEIGVKSDWFDRRMRFNFAAYVADYEDIQRTSLTVTSANTIASIITNAAKARIQGFEADLTLQPVDNFTFKVSGGMTDAKYKKFVDAGGDRTNEPFPFPEYSLAMSATYEWPTSFGAVKLSSNYSWQDDVDLGPNEKVPGALVQSAYGLLGARLAAEIDDAGVELAIFGKNITNEEYLTSGLPFDSSLGFNAAYAGEPATWGVELTKRF